MLGLGLLQGLAVTAKNFVGSFHDPARYTTIEYPEVQPKLPEAYRNFPFLVSENATDPMGTLRCVACQICEKECPPQCIYIVMDRDGKGKALKRPKVFDIDTSVCMSCQICVEVCPFDAIKMDQVFEIATTDRFTALLLNREQLAKPNSYFQSIHPTEAAEVDARLGAQTRAAEEKAKAAAAKAAAPVAVAPKPAAAEPKSAASPVAGLTEAGSPGSATPATSIPPPAASPVAGLAEAGSPGSATPATSIPPPAAPSAEAPKPPPPAA